MKMIADRVEVLSAVKWYFESKNLSLRNALAFRTPLSASQYADMRTHYSQYFVSLGSVIDLFLEKEREGSERFRGLLHRHLGGTAVLRNGESIYAFFKELRNAIVHRGLNIAAAAHISNDFPLLLLPEKLSDRRKQREHRAPCRYVIQLIEMCERAIGPAVEAHMFDLKLFREDVDFDGLLENFLSAVDQSSAMPDEVKRVALSAAGNIDHLVVYRAFLEEVRNALHPQFLSFPAQQSVAADRRENAAPAER